MSSPRVFISYSHDSNSHKQRVLELANRLRQSGIDAWIDRYSPPPEESWQLWMERQIEAARWIIIVCTETYKRRFNLAEEQGKGRGVGYESLLTRAIVYNAPGKLNVIPIAFNDKDAEQIPLPFRGSSRYVIPREFDGLVRHIIGAPEVEAPALGQQGLDSKLIFAQLPLPDIQSTGLPDELILVENIVKPLATSRKRSKIPNRRLLLVAVSPIDYGRLALGKELREISHHLRAPSIVDYDVHLLLAATEKELRQKMLEVEPQILHFCGHGGNSGPIFEQDSKRNIRHERANNVNGEMLAKWLKIAIAGQKRPLELAVLNFCDSRTMLTSLAEIADVVIGPVGQISDANATLFSSAFYMGLAFGCTGSFSYHLGSTAIEMCASLPNEDDLYGIRCRKPEEANLPNKITKGSYPPQTLAFFASEPAATTRLRLDLEFRAIQKMLRSEVFRVEARWATRVNDFLQTLLATRPSIVHLSGHGREGGFLFETNHDSNYCLTSSKALAKALVLFHAQIRCALLMFVGSSKVAALVIDVLEYVISINDAVTDDSCNEFSEEFYQMLSFGRPIPQAYEAAKLVVSDRSEAEQFLLQGRAFKYAPWPASSPTVA